MLLDEDFVEHLLAEIAHNVHYLLFFKQVHVGLFLFFFLVFLLLLHGFYCSSEIFRCGLPILSGFCGTEASLTLCHAHFLFLLHFGLLSYDDLNSSGVTCSLEVILFASELNSFLFDMNTNLQAFACFSKAFLLNFLPQP